MFYGFLEGFCKVFYSVSIPGHPDHRFFFERTIFLGENRKHHFGVILLLVCVIFC